MAVRAGSSATLLLLKLDTPCVQRETPKRETLVGAGSMHARTAARASTPAPTMFFARLTMLDGTDAPSGALPAVAAAAIRLCLAGLVTNGRNAGRATVPLVKPVGSMENASAGSARTHTSRRMRRPMALESLRM